MWKLLILIYTGVACTVDDGKTRVYTKSFCVQSFCVDIESYITQIFDEFNNINIPKYDNSSPILTEANG